MKRSLAILPCLLIPCFALSGCTNPNEATYGPSITRTEAESHLEAISVAVNQASFSLPSAYYAYDSTVFLAIFIPVSSTDKITYDTTNQFYHDVYNGNEYWAFVKDGTVYEAKSVTSTVSSKETTTQTYTAVSLSWAGAVQEMVSANNKTRTFLNAAPYPDTFLADTVKNKASTIEKGLKAFDTVATSSNSVSSSAGTTVTIQNEEYRSKADGQIYIHYVSVTKDSDGSSSTEHTYIFENNLLKKYYEKSGLIPEEIDMTYADVKLDYPTFNPTTSSASSAA